MKTVIVALVCTLVLTSCSTSVPGGNTCTSLPEKTQLPFQAAPATGRPRASEGGTLAGKQRADGEQLLVLKTSAPESDAVPSTTWAFTSDGRHLFGPGAKIDLAADSVHLIVLTSNADRRLLLRGYDLESGLLYAQIELTLADSSLETLRVLSSRSGKSAVLFDRRSSAAAVINFEAVSVRQIPGNVWPFDEISDDGTTVFSHADHAGWGPGAQPLYSFNVFDGVRTARSKEARRSVNFYPVDGHTRAILQIEKRNLCVKLEGRPDEWETVGSVTDKELYVFSTQRNQLLKIDVGSLSVRRFWQLPQGRVARTPFDSTRRAALTDGGKLLYLPSNMGVLLIDTQAEVLAQIMLPGANTTQVAVRNESVYAVAYPDNVETAKLLRIDSTGKLRQIVSLPDARVIRILGVWNVPAR